MNFIKPTENGVKDDLTVYSINGNCIYFETYRQSASKAYQDFERACMQAKINLDNFAVDYAVLRDEDLNDIEMINLR